MFLLNHTDRKQIRILIAIVVISGIISLLISPSKITLKDFVLTGDKHIDIKIADNNNIEVSNIIQKGKAKPEAVIINKSPFEDLICCPGIGNKKAEQIIKERQIKAFDDWRDLKDRIDGISTTQIEILKNAGVKLN